MARKVTPKKVTLKKPVVRRSSQAASKKPIIGLGTLITIVVFAAVILLALLLNRQKETPDTTAETTPTKGITFVFNENDGALSSIEVKPNEGEAVKLVRDAENIWAFELPAKAEADQGYVEAAAAQVSALQIIDTLSANAKPSTFGVGAPIYLITLEFADGKTHTLEVGDATPTNSGYYVRIDRNRIVITDLSGIDQLTQLVSFPPYVSTPAPEVDVTPTP